MIIKRRHTEGFTLVEMMVVVVLVSMLTIGIIGMFVAMVKGQSKNRALSEMKEEGDYIITRMERELRDAVAVDDQSDGTNTIYRIKKLTSIDGQDNTFGWIILDANKNIYLDRPMAFKINSGKYGLVDDYTGWVEGDCNTYARIIVTDYDAAKPDRMYIRFILNSPEAGIEIPFSTYVYFRNYH